MIDIQTILTYLTLISVPVGVFYHIMTLNNTRKNKQLQLETRQAQLFFNLYMEDISERSSHAHDVMFGLEFDDLEDFENKYGKENNPEAHHLINFFLNYYEGVGVLVRHGYVDIGLVAKLSSGAIRLGWEKYKPIAYASREKYKWPRWAIEFEYVYDKMIEYAEKHPELQILPSQTGT